MCSCRAFCALKGFEEQPVSQAAVSAQCLLIALLCSLAGGLAQVLVADPDGAVAFTIFGHVNILSIDNSCSSDQPVLARRNLASAFRTHIINARDSDNVASLTPVRILGSCSFLYMRSSDVYLLAVTKSNANAMLAFQFMTNVRTSWLPCDLQHFTSLVKRKRCLPRRATATGDPSCLRECTPALQSWPVNLTACPGAQMVTLLKSYFGGEFSEQSIKNNFVLIYELLDETLDFGYPQARPSARLFSERPVGALSLGLPAGAARHGVSQQAVVSTCESMVGMHMPVHPPACPLPGMGAVL